MLQTIIFIAALVFLVVWSLRGQLRSGLDSTRDFSPLGINPETCSVMTWVFMGKINDLFGCQLNYNAQTLWGNAFGFCGLATGPKNVSATVCSKVSWELSGRKFKILIHYRANDIVDYYLADEQSSHEFYQRYSNGEYEKLFDRIRSHGEVIPCLAS